MTARTESRHEFLLQEDQLQRSSLGTSRKKHNMVQQ